jgi:hypothetical protein
MEESVTINFSNLERLSKKLNGASDEANKALTTINDKLNSLNLGIEVFLGGNRLKTEVGAECDEPPGSHEETHWFLGYGKSEEGRWGLIARAANFLVSQEDEPDKLVGQTDHLLLSSPRDLRIASIEKIPRLIEELEVEAEKITNAVDKAKKLSDKL